MFQPEVKLEFVRRYCNPKDDWQVFVDIDPSEEGRTGGKRKTAERKKLCKDMQAAAPRVRKAFKKLGVQVGGNRKNWLTKINATSLRGSFPCIATDRDIVAVHATKHLLLIAEVEGESSEQPEQKLYKTIGQLVLAVVETRKQKWQATYVLVVHGDKIATHLKKARILRRLHISALHLTTKQENDEWLFYGKKHLNAPSGRTKPPTGVTACSRGR